MPKPATLTAREMVDRLDLQSINFYEVGARLSESRRADLGEADDRIETETSWGVRVRHEGNEFGVRIRTETNAPLGEVVVDVAAEYVSDEPLLLSREATNEYVNNVALMQLFPYIREATMAMSDRVFGRGILLPPLVRGQLTFTLGDGPDSSPGSDSE